MFIAFEGIEGSGKTSQLRRLAELLRAHGRTVVTTKEPGGTPLADRIRTILLDTQSVIDPTAELFLFAASRRQHVTEVIGPALERGEVVLCDRFTDSTLAYQGFGRRLPLDQLRTLNAWATGQVQPASVIIFDLAEEKGLARARKRNASAIEDEGRFEAEDLRFHRRVREGYLSLAAAEPQRYAIVDADGTPDEVFARLVGLLGTRAPGLLA
ncbi:MAG: dTMP kinase [Thermoanaerobaculia bacterium]